ncbi:MAG: GNAT family N-acetyltransferase [Candidatus Omnitrophica bacterium]|nr:GNAT family N-acetyltransferase [Candidatus Omnitrophota bacterium]
MYTIKNKFSGIIRTLSLVVVCFFTINTLAWAYPTEDTSPKKYDLAVQSIFKPIVDAGVEVSAKMQFEILAGAMLLLSGRSAAATNAYLAETYIKSKSTETRKIDFLEIRDRDRGLPATFKIVGKDDLVFELDFQGTLTGDKGMNRVPRKPKLPADISGKVMKYANFLNDNGILLIRELTRSKDEREVPRPEISDVEPPEKGAAIPYTANTFAWRTIHTADWEPRGFVAILKRLLKDAPGIIRARIRGVMPTYAISRTLPTYDAMAVQMYDITPELNRGISGLIESYISKNKSENKTTAYLDACGGLGCAATEVSVRYGRDGARVYMTDIVEWTADDISAGDARNTRQEGAKRGIKDILSRQFEFIKADVVSVSLPEKMDVITNIAGLQYTDDPLQTIVNLYNQLKIGGTLLTGYWARQENKSALEHFYITLEAIARLGAKVDVKTTYLEGEGAYIIGIAITRNDDRDIKLNLIPVEVKNLEALDKVRDLFQKVVYYRADGSGSAISIRVPSHDSNVTCGTICQAGHEGSYQALDEQLSRKFAEYKALLGITEDRDLTESEVDMALNRQGHIQDPNQLDQIRKWVREHGSIPDNISIFFGVPENGKKLWYVGEDYAGGHFNQAGTRIHISLPLILSQTDPRQAALDIALHDYNHIVGKGHLNDPGLDLVSRIFMRERGKDVQVMSEISAEAEEAFSMRRDALIRSGIYSKDDLAIARDLYDRLAKGEPLEKFSAYEKLDIWKYMIMMNMHLVDVTASRHLYGGGAIFKVMEDEIRKISRGKEVEDLFIGYGWTDRLSPESKVASLESNLNIRAGTRMLDIGCGRGNVVIDLAVKNPGAEFVGIEANPYNLAHAVTRLVEMGDKAPRNVRFRMRDCRSPVPGREVPGRGIPYPDDEFDIVSLLEGVMDEASFMGSWQDLLWREAIRVAKKENGNIAFFGLVGEGAFKPSLPEGVQAEDKPNTFFVIDGKRKKYYYPPWTMEEDPSPYRRDGCELCVWQLRKGAHRGASVLDDKGTTQPRETNQGDSPIGHGSQMDMFESLQSQTVIRGSEIGKPAYPGDGPGGASILDLPVKKMEEAKDLFEVRRAISLRAAATGSKIMEIITLLEDAMHIFESVVSKGIKEDRRSLGRQNAETAKQLLLEAEDILKEAQDLYNRWWSNRLRLRATPSHTYSGRTIYTQSVMEGLIEEGDVIVELGIGDKDAPTFRELKRSIDDRVIVKAIEFNSGNIPDDLRSDVVQDNILALRRGGEASRIIGEAKVIRTANLVETYFDRDQRERLLRTLDSLMSDGSYLIISNNVPGEEMFEGEEGYLYQKRDGGLRLDYFISSRMGEEMFKDGIEIGSMKAVPASSEFLKVPEGLWPPWQDKDAGAGEDPSYSIVPLTKELLSDDMVAEKLLELHKLIPIPPITKEELMADFREENAARWDFEGKWEHSLVALDKTGKPVGFLIAYERPGGEIEGVDTVSLYIHKFAVDTGWQENGIGTEMLRMLARNIEERGFIGQWDYRGPPYPISLQTPSTNERAIRYYLNRGFKKVGVRKTPERTYDVYLTTSSNLIKIAGISTYEVDGFVENIDIDHMHERAIARMRKVMDDKTDENVSASAEPRNESTMDGASWVRLQPALSDIFKELKGPMYYPAAGNDFGFLLWSVYAFPGVTEYVFRDSLDQKEAGAYRPDKNDIKAVAEWIEVWIRQDLGNEVEDANRDIKVKIRDDKTVNIWIKFDKMSIYEGREINISYEIGDLFENNSQYPVVHIQEPGLMGRFSEHKSFWEHIEHNTANEGLILASQWATGYAQLLNSSYIGTTEDRVMADILVYRKDKKSASAPNENEGRLMTPRQKLGVVPIDSRGTINDEPGLPPMGGGQDYATVRNLSMTKSVPELVEVARGMIHDGLGGQIDIIRDGLRERDVDMLQTFETLLAGGHSGAIMPAFPTKNSEENPISVNVMNSEGEGFDDIFVMTGKASPVLGAEDLRLARSDLDVCVAVSAYNKNTLKRFMVHILPSGHMDSQYFSTGNLDDLRIDFEEAKKRYMAALFSNIDLLAEGPISGWRFVVSKGPGMLKVDPSGIISPEDVKNYLTEQKMVGADNIGLDLYNPPGTAIKRVVLDKDGVVSIFCRFPDDVAFNRYLFDLTGGSISPIHPASFVRRSSSESSPEVKDGGSQAGSAHSDIEENPNAIMFESRGLSVSDVRELGVSEAVIPEADMVGFNTALRDRSLWSTEIDMDSKEKIIGLMVELIGNAQNAVGFQNEKQARARLSYHPGPKILELDIAQDVLQEADLLKLKNNHAKYIERGLVYFSTEYATRSRDKSLVTNYGSGLEIFAQVALKHGAVLEYLPGDKGMRTRLYVRVEALPGSEEDFVVEWQSSGKGQYKTAILPVEKSDLLYAPGRIEAPVAVRGGLGTEEQPRMTDRTVRTETTKDGARVVLRDKIPPVAEMRHRIPPESDVSESAESVPVERPVMISDEKARAFFEALGIERQDLEKAGAKFPQLIGLNPARIQKDFKDHLGIERDDLARAILKSPNLAGYNPSRVRKGYEEVFGIGREELARAILKFPPLAGLDPSRVQRGYEESLGINRDDLAHAILRFPQIASFDPFRAQKDFEKVLGINRDDLARAILKFPSLAGRDPSRAQKSFEETLGINSHDLARAILKSPQLVSLSMPNNLKPKLDMIRSLGMSSDREVDELIIISILNLNVVECIFNTANELSVKLSSGLDIKAIYNRVERQVNKDMKVTLAALVKKDPDAIESIIRPLVKNALTGWSEDHPGMTDRTVRTETTKDGARVVLRDKPPAEMRKSVLSGPAPESKGYSENRSVAPRKEVGLSIVNRSSLTAKENLPYNENDKRLTINDERTLLRDAVRVLKSYPVNMPIDISLIPRQEDGLSAEEAAGQLDDNMETLARLMAWHNTSGLDVRYALVDSDEDYRAKALGLLKEKLTRLAAMPGIRLDVEAMLKLHTESNMIEVLLVDMEALKGMKTMPDNMYPVALLRDMEGAGVNIPNYTAAAAIGLSLAGLRIASQRAAAHEYQSRLKEAFETIERIYKRWGVDTKDFNKSVLDMMVNTHLNFSGESRRQLIISLKLALPPMLKAAIEKLHEVHQAIQLMLQSA